MDEHIDITWFGHSCFLLAASGGVRILMDPFDEEVGYAVPRVSADLVTVSHDHFDHNNTKAAVGTPKVLRGAGEWNAGGVRIRGVSTHHDDVGGAKRGPNTVFVIESDGLVVCHMGDIGHVPCDDVASDIGEVDVLMVPVGGTYTLDADGAAAAAKKLSARIVIPMHYWTAGSSVKVAGVEPFLAKMASVSVASNRVLRVTPSELPDKQTAVVLSF